MRAGEYSDLSPVYRPVEPTEARSLSKVLWLGFGVIFFGGSRIYSCPMNGTSSGCMCPHDAKDTDHQLPLNIRGTEFMAKRIRSGPFGGSS